MKTREIIGLLIGAVALLVVAVAVNVYHLWSSLGNYTVPWLLSSVAAGTLLVGIVSILTGNPPKELSLRVAIVVIVGASVAVGVGMLVDYFSYGVPAGDWLASIAEWAGFTVVLIFLFWIPRIGRKVQGKQQMIPSSAEQD